MASAAETASSTATTAQPWQQTLLDAGAVEKVLGFSATLFGVNTTPGGLTLPESASTCVPTSPLFLATTLCDTHNDNTRSEIARSRLSWTSLLSRYLPVSALLQPLTRAVTCLNNVVHSFPLSALASLGEIWKALLHASREGMSRQSPALLLNAYVASAMLT